MDDSTGASNNCAVSDAASSSNMELHHTGELTNPQFDDGDSIPSEFVKLYLKFWPEYLYVLIIIKAPLVALSIADWLISSLAPAYLGAFTTVDLLLGVPFRLIPYYMAPAVVSVMVGKQILGIKVDLWESLALVWDRIVPVLTAGVAATLLSAVGTLSLSIISVVLLSFTSIGISLKAIAGICFVFFASLFYTLFLFTPIVSVFEEESGFSAPMRSASLIWQSARSFIRLYFLLAVAFGVIAYLGTVNWFLGFIVNPAYFAFPAFLYYYYRKKYEEFSLEKHFLGKRPDPSMMGYSD